MVDIKLYAHQVESLKFMRDKHAVFDASSPGTGKTLVQIKDFEQRNAKDHKAALIFCPKSLMRAAWMAEIEKFAPHLKVFIADATNRKNITYTQADIYVINIDGVKDIAKIKDKKWWERIDTIIIDESSNVKHSTSQRSKAIREVMKKTTWRRCLSGTPASNGICDIWHQYFLLDDGKRLGKSFFGFRNNACIAQQNGPSPQHIKWIDRPGIDLIVHELVKDITIRHKFEDCVDIPENTLRTVSFELTKKHRALYEKLERDSLLEINKTQITAINAASLATKILQAASGAAYNDSGTYSYIASERYELIIELAKARQHSVVFYLWTHQLLELAREADKYSINFAMWDPSHPEIAQKFQEGKYQILFAHPASAAHGLTLTRASTTIWSSPTYNLEHFLQGNKRIHRIGQAKKTETLVVIAKDTIDERVAQALEAKKINLSALLTRMENKT
jgi:SNF2 family DNA or RNA helicase